MSPETTEAPRYEALAEDILKLDQRIFSCAIVSNPQGAMVARATRPEFQHVLGKSPEGVNGMAAHWAILAFNAMERLNEVRSKAKYLCVGREKNKALIFPINSALMMIMVLNVRTEATEIYELTTKFISEYLRIQKL